VKVFFPDVFARLAGQVLFCVRDGDNRVIYGHAIDEPSSSRLFFEGRFPTTLYRWKLQMSPTQAASLILEERQRRRSDVLLTTFMLGVVLAAIGFLVYASIKESRANQLKSDFISNVSHELKTPLAVIRMFSELLSTERVRAPEKVKEYGETITREAERLSRLIENVLDFSRIERGGAAYEFQEGRLDAVVERALDVYRHRIEREGLRLITKIDDDLPPVLIDENAMTLLLLNLLENAVKYSKDGETTIRIEVEPTTPKIVKIVLRNRAEPANIAAIREVLDGVAKAEDSFDFYQKLLVSIAKNKVGSGLGLARICAEGEMKVTYQVLEDDVTVIEATTSVGERN
jgi:two-component system phosphate regulon sensor histidine kinase PhoR